MPEPTLSDPSYSVAEVRAIAYMAAGSASGVFMQRHPKDVMPADDIKAGVERVLASCNVPKED